MDAIDEDLAEGVETMDVDDLDEFVEDDFDGDVPDEDDDEEEDAEEEEGPRDRAFRELQAHTDSVYAVAMTREACLTGGGDDVAYLTRGDVVKKLEGHTDSVTSVGFSFNGELCGTGSYDGTVRIWDMEGTLIQKLEGPGDVEWLEFHPRGDVIVAGSQDGTVWLWEARTASCLRVFVGHDGPASCGMFTSDGNSIVTGSTDGTVRLWAPKKGTCKHVWKFDDPVIQLKKSNDVIAAALDGPSIAVLHVKAKKIIATLSLDTNATAIALDSWAAVGDANGTVRIYDYSKDIVRHALSFDQGAVVDLLWHDLRVIAAFVDVVRCLDARSGSVLYDIRGHSDLILAVAFVSADNDDDLLLSAGDDRVPRLFRAHRSGSSSWALSSSSP